MCSMPGGRGQRDAFLPPLQGAADRRFRKGDEAVLRECEDPPAHSRHGSDRIEQADRGAADFRPSQHGRWLEEERRLQSAT